MALKITERTFAECPCCHLMFSLEGCRQIAIYCSKRCRNSVNNSKFRAQHREQYQAQSRKDMRRRRLKLTPLSCVDTACLPV